MTTDAIFAEYSIDQAVDGPHLDILREAMLSPSSPGLRRIIRGAWESEERHYYSTEQFKAAHQEGLGSDEALYRSEALERMVMGHALADRLGGRSNNGKPLWRLGQILEWSARTYSPPKVDWNWKAIERLVRARVHGSETIGASNSLIFLLEHYDPVSFLSEAPEPDEACRMRLAVQLRRLEQSKQRTRVSGGRDGYFKPRDADLLEALSKVAGQSSGTLARIRGERDLAGAERRRLVESVSEPWRSLFDALFDISSPPRAWGT